MSITFLEPAARWKPSTFWVRVQTLSKRFSNPATTAWARLNRAPRQADSICPRYFQVSAGSRLMVFPDNTFSIGIPSSVGSTS